MTLIARGLSYRYPGETGFVLPPTHLTVTAGRILAVVGPSGSGKSTLGRLLAGLLAPTSGTVTVTTGGQETPLRPRRGRLPGHTALLAQDPAGATDPRLTLRRMIALPALARGLAVDVEGLAEEVGLDPGLLARRPGQVSGGQLQRACLARALAQRPDYLLADEVSAHLDDQNARRVAEVLRSRADRGLAILAITHDTAMIDGWADAVHVLPPGGPGARVSSGRRRSEGPRRRC